MNKKPYICISPDIDVLYQDSEGCCTSAYGDMISEERPSLGPRFSIVVPGIEEWVKRYEMATDFAETETDPAFDWATWHYEGLCFAKAIWEQLPRCYTLYYDPPFEDRSGTIGKVVIDENVNRLIELLHPLASRTETPLSTKDNIVYKFDRKENGLQTTLRINELVFDLTLPYSCMTNLKH